MTTNASAARGATTGERAPHVPAAIAAGASLIVLALMLYASELSRAAAVAIVPFGLCLLGAALYARGRNHWPPRAWLIAFGTLALATLAYAFWLFVYGQMHPPMPS